MNEVMAAFRKHHGALVIPSTLQAVDGFRHDVCDYGMELVVLTKKQLAQLTNGMVLAMECNGGEYTVFAIVGDE